MALIVTQVRGNETLNRESRVIEVKSINGEFWGGNGRNFGREGIK